MTVAPGATATVDVGLGSEVQVLSAFTVTADKEGRALDLYGDAINVTAVPMVFQGPMPGRRDSISYYGANVSFGFSGRF